MKISWTKQQEKVIRLRNRNILVSAAAGSGKTAVLVERIVSKLCDSQAPVDIDQMLIVTFTNAAAAEMRERIGQAIGERLLEEPEHAQLRRQETLLQHAQIMTIDSFCLKLLRDYFYLLELDPSFRIAEEGEWKLLSQDVLDQLLEDCYEKEDVEFLEFTETYATGRDDGRAADMILQLYSFAVSAPWPLEWLSGCQEFYQQLDEQELESCSWMKQLLRELRREWEEILESYDRMLRLCSSPQGPGFYRPFLQEERQGLQRIADCQKYSTMQEAISTWKFQTKPRKPKAEICSEELQEQVSALRDLQKKRVQSLAERFFSRTLPEQLESLRLSGRAASTLCRLTMQFYEAFAAEKKKKNLLDFSDLEHLALQLLLHREEAEDGSPVWSPTETAKQLRRQYEEIMIDEYQDSNAVQELLLTSISREEEGTPNIFMVGDVKQSIYRFRQARPELFMEKYASYTEEDSLYQKIELHQNFRSRETLLAQVNYFFYQLMQESVGGIRYTEEAALHPGVKYEPGDERTGGPLELLLLDPEDSEDPEETESGKEEAEDPASENHPTESEGRQAMIGEAMNGETEHGLQEGHRSYQAREWEAKLIADRIRQLVHPQTGQKIWDAKEKAYRTACYGDIVILLRTMKGWAEDIQTVLMSEGIPAVTDSRSGYFSAYEVRMLLNLLQIVDNPIQDIPLVGVMSSPIGGFSHDELARIRSTAGLEQENGFYGAVVFYREQFEMEPLGQKLKAFLERLETYRLWSGYLPLPELLQRLLQDTGFYLFAQSMPGGERRRANLDMLLEKAAAFEQTSYRGVFQYVRYIQKLKEYSVDYGEAMDPEALRDAVRIMSIHKSKGLEFPIVIVAGLGKPFNRQDSRQTVLFHPDYGVAADAIDPIARTQETTLFRQFVQHRLELDSLGEELRVLYVAMTRAREKLILTGSRRKLWEWLSRSLREESRSVQELSYRVVSQASCFLDWILPALARHQSLKPLYEQLQLPAPTQDCCYQVPIEAIVRLDTKSRLELQTKADRVERAVERRLLEQELFLNEEERGQEAFVREQLLVRYQYDDLWRVNGSLAVSHLRFLQEEEEKPAWLPGIPETEESLPETKESLPETEDQLPRFLQTDEEISKRLSGAARGTAYHRALQWIEPQLDMSFAKLCEQLDELQAAGRLTAAERAAIQPRRLYGFYQSDLGKRAALAAAAGQYHREEAFLMGVEPGELFPEYQLREESLDTIAGSWIALQGVIDAWFEEEDGIVLLDFKTDYLQSEAEADRLKKRYRLQLDYYTKALERRTKKRVKERYLYSLSLQRALPVS